MVASIGVRFTGTVNYILDESRGSLAAVKAKKTEVNAAIKEMTKSEQAQIKYYNQLAGKGCSVSAPKDALDMYKGYKAKLNKWRKMMVENNRNTKKMLVTAGRAKQTQNQKTPIGVDKDYAGNLLLSFENCELTNWAMVDYFLNVSFKKLTPADVFPPPFR